MLCTTFNQLKIIRMNEPVRLLLPQTLWNHFADLNAVPRPSKKEQQVIRFIEAFAQSLQLMSYQDKAGNVIIKKPATAGMENKVTVVLQSHVDMVHQKNAGTEFDFEKDGILMSVEGDFVKAHGTTLGADNGIGVATIMALLSSTEIPHPALEALFTVDEETGMTGAFGLEPGLLKGSVLLNLDTEEDDELTIGCAGGVDVTCSGSYQSIENKKEAAFKISLKGLTGGHSGMDIFKGRGNANKLMNRLLWQLVNDFSINISEWNGGGIRNAIPRESEAKIVCMEEQVNELVQSIHAFSAILKSEFSLTDPGLQLLVKEIEKPATVLETNFQCKLLAAIYSCPNGIYRMSTEIPNLVQTSNNIACINIQDDSYSIQCLARSSQESEKTDLTNAIKNSFFNLDCKVTLDGIYPGWQPKPDSPIVTMMSNLHQELFATAANVDVVHAGLECGIIGNIYPDMQMISFGPNIFGAHSPDEKVQISSVQKYWNFLLEALKRMPERTN